MIDIDTAAKIAEEVLNNHFKLVDDVVIVFDPSEDDYYYWFQYNSRRYMETGDLMFAIVEGRPIGISKNDGSIA